MSTSSLGDEAANFYAVWEVEANGRSKIMEAKERRMKRIQEARYLAQIEIERFREQKEAEFKSKCQSIEHEDGARKHALIRDVEKELDYMEARVHLCKPAIVELLEILTTTATYAIHHNVETRRWIAGYDHSTAIPPNRRQCDEKTWELLQQYVLKCEDIAAKVPRPTD